MQRLPLRTNIELYRIVFHLEADLLVFQTISLFEIQLLALAQTGKTFFQPLKQSLARLRVQFGHRLFTLRFDDLQGYTVGVLPQVDAQPMLVQKQGHLLLHPNLSIHGILFKILIHVMRPALAPFPPTFQRQIYVSLLRPAAQFTDHSGFSRTRDR